MNIMNIFLAIFLGTLFGFVLHRIGASNPQNIFNMLRLNDLLLMKTILWGIAIASTLLFLGLSVGMVNSAHLSIKATYGGVLLGGAIFGIGWALSGYCPGTGIAAVGEGRKDSIFFVLGGLAGAFLYMIVYSHLKDTALMRHILGGKSTLALTPVGDKFPALIKNVPGIVVALLLAIIFSFIAWKLPEKESE